MTLPIAGERDFRRRLAVCIAAALTLGGCESAGLGARNAVPESEQALSATSPANIASLSEVVQRNPNDPQAYNIRGTVFGQAGRNAEALADFNKAISLDPNYAQAFANRGLIYRQTGQFDLALADYNRALSINPSYSAAYLGRGMVYRERKQLMLSLNDFNRSIALKPDKFPRNRAPGRDDVPCQRISFASELVHAMSSSGVWITG